jgi:hypothetical protein
MSLLNQLEWKEPMGMGIMGRQTYLVLDLPQCALAHIGQFYNSPLCGHHKCGGSNPPQSEYRTTALMADPAELDFSALPKQILRIEHYVLAMLYFMTNGKA